MEKNVAFSTLLLLVLATPGYFFLLTFNAGRLNKNVLPKEWIQDVLRMIFYSFPFHILALFAVAHIIPPEWVKPHEVSADVFHLLVGTSTNTTITPLYDRLYSAIHWIIAYFFAVIVIAALVGYVSRWAVWEGRLDVKFETLRYNNNWLYFFTGRDRVPSLQHGFHDLLQAIQLACGWLHPKYRIASIVDVLVEVEGVSRIYRGQFYDFSTDSAGNPVSVSLLATRTILFKDWEVPVPPWSNIPGEVFAIRFEEVKNINVTYLPLAEIVK
jgi:hypothetical protein